MVLTFIAQTIKVSVNTVSREIKRNRNSHGMYNSRVATLRSHRCRSCVPGNRPVDSQFCCEVFSLTREHQWLARQVPGRLRKKINFNMPIEVVKKIFC